MKDKNKFRFFSLIISLIIALSIFSGCSVSESTNAETATATTSQNAPTSGLRVHYIDVGQADSILIQSPDNKNMLIDAGETKEKAVLNYLNAQGVKRLDVVIATHPHNDHISEMADVIKSYEIGSFYMPKVTHTSKSFEKMVDALKAKNISPIAAKAGMSFNLEDDIKCDIVAPNSDKYDNLNNYSIVLKLTYGENSFLFTGDAEELSEKEILNSGADISADVLKVGHHGSSSSTSAAFLKAVNPQYAVISCGKDNDYGHPHKETIEKLKGINTYITKDNGNIIISSDSKNISVYCDNGSTQKADSVNATNVKTANKQNNAVIKTESNTDTGSYIGNKNSKKYHSSDCSQLPNEENRVYFSSKSEAENQGYEPHKNCIK